MPHAEQLSALGQAVISLPQEDARHYLSYLAKNESEYDGLGARDAQWIAKFDRMRGFKLSDTDRRLRI